MARKAGQGTLTLHSPESKLELAGIKRLRPMSGPLDELTKTTVLHDLTGTSVGRFFIRKRIGAGGMGQVYRADDNTLKREVAIKRMAPKFQFDERDRKRFLKEAQRASSLNHPNIAAAYDVLEHNGEILLVMEYVEGVTLRERMMAPFSIEQFVDIATQCLDGLGAAHERHIVHGDIKPENIMLTPASRVKILDFGVAKHFPISGPTEPTESLTSMTASLRGTPSYMAPEVLKQRVYDGRADLFSLGVVFYELLGGKHPFQADSFADTVAQVLHSEPPPLHEAKREVPVSLSAIVDKLLVKDPGARYLSAGAVVTDLCTTHVTIDSGLVAVAPKIEKQARRSKTIKLALGILVASALLIGLWPVRHFLQSAVEKIWRPMPPLPAAQVLAVLPFSSPGGDTKLDALGKGLVESVAAKLGGLSEDRSLEVIPARSMQEKSTTSLAEARQQFGANLGLAITLQHLGDFIRVSYSLLDAKSGRTMGGDSITVPATDVFAVEDRIAEGAVRVLHLNLRPDEQAMLKLHGTSQAAAYGYYLQARGYLLDYSKPENLENAILMAQEALKHDPNFGTARAALGEAYWRKYWFTKAKEWVGPAREECDEAVKLGNAGAAGHICLGLVKDGTGKYEEAAAEYQRAVELARIIR